MTLERPPQELSHAERLANLRLEETVNCITHGIGFLLSLAGVVALLYYVAPRGDHWQIAACAVFGVSMVAVYFASTLSHLFFRPRLRYLFRIADQACIFLMIAGTFTPVAVTYLRSPWGWGLLAAMWAIALTGFALKALFQHRIDAVSTRLHVFLGWLPTVSARTMLALAPGAMLLLFLAGGLFYTVGTLFLHYDRRHPLMHGVWHLCVIAGSACHYSAVLWYCTTPPAI